jgi:hypothetical protein
MAHLCRRYCGVWSGIWSATPAENSNKSRLMLMSRLIVILRQILFNHQFGNLSLVLEIYEISQADVAIGLNFASYRW